MDNLNTKYEFGLKKIILDDTGFILFRKEVMGRDIGTVHIQWDDFIRRINAKCKLRKMKQYGLILAPADHGKSTHFAVDYVLWQLARNQNLRIVVSSNTDRDAQGFLAEVKENIELNSIYQQYFPEVIPNKNWWRNDSIKIKRNKIMKDPTVRAVGCESGGLGKRADIIIADDILDIDNTATESQRNKVKQWVMDILLKMLDPKYGICILVGTLQHHLDLYSEILNNEDGNYDDWERLKQEALNEDTNEVLWEERYRLEQLLAEKKLNPESFNRRFQNVVLAEEDKIFPSSAVKRCCDAGRNYVLKPKRENREQILFSGWDLAIAEKKVSKWTACVTLEWLKAEKKLVIVDIIRKKIKSTELGDAIAEHYLKFYENYILVENNSFQEVIVSQVKSMLLPVKGYYTGKQKNDNVVGIPTLGNRVKNVDIIFPMGDDYSKEMVALLINELIYYPQYKTSDIMMALWFSVLAFQEVIGKNTMPVMSRMRSLMSVGSRMARFGNI